jgi:hypothetical protein
LTERTEYRGYLLRLWREGPEAPWRAHLRSIATGQEHRLSSLEALFAFLEQETEIDALPGSQAELRNGVGPSL